MAQEATKKGSVGKNDTLAFIIGGLFILGLVFATYNYFSNQIGIDPNGDQSEQSLTLERLRETLSSRTSEEDDPENMDRNMTEDTPDVETPFVEVGAWVPNDYQEGDIETGNYSVVEGDTLWEIAEGAYGDGSMWTQIRDANAENIDFLPNGQQALIYAGQTLVIPSITG